MSSSVIDDLLEAIDRYNESDPAQRGGQPVAKLHGQRGSFWLGQLTGRPGAALTLSARAHHVGRFEVPRSSFAAGRVGYHQWKSAAREYCAGVLGELGDACSVDVDVLSEACELVRKTSTDKDSAQVHQDVCSLVFFEVDAAELSQRLTAAQVERAVRSTLAAMSDSARVFLDSELIPTEVRTLVDTVSS